MLFIISLPNQHYTKIYFTWQYSMCKIALKFANWLYLVYNIHKLRREFMWFENVVVILTWFIILTICLKICIKKKSIANFMIVGLDILLAVIYFSINIMNIEQNADVIKIFAFVWSFCLSVLFLYSNINLWLQKCRNIYV